MPVRLIHTCPYQSVHRGGLGRPAPRRRLTLPRVLRLMRAQFHFSAGSVRLAGRQGLPARRPASTEKHLLNGGRWSEFCKMGVKPGLGSAAILAGTEMQGFALMASSWREIRIEI